MPRKPPEKLKRRTERLAENSGPEPAKKGRGPGRPFEKGVSGNPGGRSKEIAKLQEDLLAMSPDAVKAMGDCLRGPPAEEMEARGNDFFWLKAWADKRLAALKIWFAFTLPPPRHGDEFDKPMTIPAPENMTTLELISEAKALVAAEIARLRAVSATGIPLSETASARLTESVKQIAVIVEQEKKILDSDPYAGLTDQELKERAENAN